MRSESTATCTSAEPVSPGFLAYSEITSCLRSVVIVIRSSSSKVEDTERPQLSFRQFGQRDRLALGGGEKDRKPLKIVASRNDVRQPGEQIRAGEDRIAASEANRIRTRHGQRRDAVQRGRESPKVQKGGGTIQNPPRLSRWRGFFPRDPAD